MMFPRVQDLLERPFSRIRQREVSGRAQRLRPRPRARRGVRAVRRPGARRDHGRRRDRQDRPAHGRADASRSRSAPRSRCWSSRWPGAASPSGCAPSATGSAVVRVAAGAGRDRAGGRAHLQRDGRAAAHRARLHRQPEQRRSTRPAPTRTSATSRPRAWPSARRSRRRRCRTAARRRPSPASSSGSTRPATLPLNAASLNGKVVLVDFWAYSCINCQRAIPHVEAWYKAYKADGLEVIGVHTPEYAFEHVASNVAAGAKRLRHHLPGRAGQQLHDLEQLRQRLLAGRIPDRRDRRGAARLDRRGRLLRRPRR